MAVAEYIAEPIRTAPYERGCTISSSSHPDQRYAQVMIIGECTDETRDRLDAELWGLIQHHDTITIDCSRAPFVSEACRETFSIISDILRGTPGNRLTIVGIRED